MEVNEFIEKNKQPFLKEFLIPWLKIPSISLDPNKKEETEKAASFLVEELKKSGLNAELKQLNVGNPVVYAEKIVDANKPTVLIYGHYDVQPIKEPDKWGFGEQKLEPFNPMVVGERIYGRGTADDKGQFSAYILAMRYFNSTSFPCNIKFIVEGNEEGGESSFVEFIKSNKELLQCDAIFISDTATLVEGVPAITTSLKGILTVELQAESYKQMVNIIHKLHDPTKNKILLAGFYSDVVEREIDQKMLEKSSKPDPDMGNIKPEEGFSQLEHRWYRPTYSPLFLRYVNPRPSPKMFSVEITAHGPRKVLHSGHYGGPVPEPGLNLAHLLAALDAENVEYQLDYIDYGSEVLSTSIQPTGKMQLSADKEINLAIALMKYDLNPELFTIAKIEKQDSYITRYKSEDAQPKACLSFRLVPNQDPSAIYNVLESFVSEQGGMLEKLGSGEPLDLDVSNKYAHAMIKGLKDGFGSSDVDVIGEGGSIPITNTLKETLGVPIILAGVSSPNDNLHAPNESLLLEKGLFAGAKSIISALKNIKE